MHSPVRSTSGTATGCATGFTWIWTPGATTYGPSARPGNRGSGGSGDAVSRLLERLARLMPADISLTVILAVLVADLFVLQPIEILSGWAKFLIDLISMSGII